MKKYRIDNVEVSVTQFSENKGLEDGFESGIPFIKTPYGDTWIAEGEYIVYLPNGERQMYHQGLFADFLSKGIAVEL